MLDCVDDTCRTEFNYPLLDKRTILVASEISSCLPALGSLLYTLGGGSIPVFLFKILEMSQVLFILRE